MSIFIATMILSCSKKVIFGNMDVGDGCRQLVTNITVSPASLSPYILIREDIHQICRQDNLLNHLAFCIGKIKGQHFSLFELLRLTSCRNMQGERSLDFWSSQKYQDSRNLE